MVIHHVYDELFRSWSHIAVLRSIIDTTIGCTGNEIARRSGMHPRSALKALTSLEQLGVVHRQRGGRDHIFTLNRNHYLVCHAIQNIFADEQEFCKAINKDLSSLFKRKVLNATIFGSVAKQTENPFSDLDLCVIVKETSQKEIVRKILNMNALRLFQSYGVKIAPIIFTAEEIKTKSKTNLIRNILAEGKIISGKELNKLI